jgi:Tol biopolymer transport system component
MSGKSPLRRLTFEGANFFPVWSPDGKQLAFYSNRENKPGIFLQAADGTGTAQRLAGLPPANGYIPSSWNGKTIAFADQKVDNTGIWTMSFSGDRKAELFISLPDTLHAHAAFSPNGHWIAYTSSESSGQTRGLNIYVQPFPKTGAARYQISREGWSDVPVWSPDGKELFYFRLDSSRLMAVAVQTQPTFSFGQPRELPIAGIVQDTGGRRYDVTSDGKRFLVILPPDQTAGKPRRTQQVNVILNWFDELKGKQGK